MAAGGILSVHGEKNERKETVVSSAEGVSVLRAEVCGACDYCSSRPAQGSDHLSLPSLENTPQWHQA